MHCGINSDRFEHQGTNVFVTDGRNADGEDTCGSQSHEALHDGVAMRNRFDVVAYRAFAYVTNFLRVNFVACRFPFNVKSTKSTFHFAFRLCNESVTKSAPLPKIMV